MQFTMPSHIQHVGGDVPEEQPAARHARTCCTVAMVRLLLSAFDPVRIVWRKAITQEKGERVAGNMWLIQAAGTLHIGHTMRVKVEVPFMDKV
eukprot:m.251415 g.251415  ORF g.251415 m.251415 type:complete len:93 (+) comp19537_c0_seq5:978-1256(+)